MLPKDRVTAALKLEQTDKIPIYQAGFSSQVGSYILGRTAFVGGGIQRFRESVALWRGGQAHAEYVEKSFEDACELCEKLDLDLVRTAYWRKSDVPTERIDENTFLYGRRNGKPEDQWEIWRFDPPTEIYGLVERYPDVELDEAALREAAEGSIESANSYRPTTENFPDYVQAIGRFGKTRAIHGGGVGIAVPREREWLEAMVLYPEVVARFLDAQVIRASRNAEVMAQLGLQICFGGGDFAGNAGPFYSPAIFHELMFPRLKRISEACHNAGVMHWFASDGDLWSVADDIFGASGVDGFYEVDRNYMPIPTLRKRYPQLKLLGGIRSSVLHRGTIVEVREETRSALHQAREAQGCVIGCSNQIVAGTPEENFWAMMDEIHEHR